MPLGQHIGIPSEPVVKVGEVVQRGQLIATANGFISTVLHSPVTGKITDIGMHRYFDGSFKRAVEIEADPYATQQFFSRNNTNITPDKPSSGLMRPGLNSGLVDPDLMSPDLMSKEQFIDAVQMSGIVGMGGAAFPSHVKYSIPEEQHITDLLVNGAECEPFLTNSDHSCGHSETKTHKTHYIDASSLRVKHNE